MTVSRSYKAEGIILKRKNIGEADRIITVFTREYGKLRLIAKGIRKVASRRAPHLEVFTRVRLIVHAGKTLESISEVEPIEIYEQVRSDLSRVSMAYYLCELIDSLVAEKQEHNDVFVLLSRGLRDLGAGKVSSIYAVSKTFTLELLWTLGFLPKGRTLSGDALQQFIETITERRMKSTKFARHILDQAA